MQSDNAVTSRAVSQVERPQRAPISHAELRALVRHWVAMLKEAGVAPEEVLIAVKSLVRETIVPRYSDYAEERDGTASPIAFVRDAAQWCIETYYEDVADGR